MLHFREVVYILGAQIIFLHNFEFSPAASGYFEFCFSIVLLLFFPTDLVCWKKKKKGFFLQMESACHVAV